MRRVKALTDPQAQENSQHKLEENRRQITTLQERAKGLGLKWAPLEKVEELTTGSAVEQIQRLQDIFLK